MEQDIYRTIGRRIRSRRRLLDLTQSDVGRACGISAQLVSKYEAAQIALPFVKLLYLAHALDVPIGYFTDQLTVDRGDASQAGAGRMLAAPEF